MSARLESLADAAVSIAARGAVDYLRAHDLTADSAALAECLRSWVTAKMGEALADAAEALACNMSQLATATFGASMLQAGIEAAKEACGL